MLTIQEHKIREFEAEMDTEFLYDLIYEIIRDNKALKLNNCFIELLNPVKKLLDYYLKQGIDQIETLKYMVKSHVYLGQDYIEDTAFSWLRKHMQSIDEKDQLSYVNHFRDLVEDYKLKVLGSNFEKLIVALEKCKNLKTSGDLKIIYPEKYDFLISKNIINAAEYQLYPLEKNLKYVLGFNYEKNVFFSQILRSE